MERDGNRGRRPFRFGPFLAVLALVVCGSVLPRTALGAESALEVLQVGWGGNVVPGSWSPVRVRVTGGSGDAVARVEVILKNRYQPGPQAAAIEYPMAGYGQEVALPAGVAKEVVIWAPVDGAMVGSVRLTVGGQTLAEERVEFRGVKTPYWPLVGVLAEAPAVARSLSQVELPVQGLPMPLAMAKLAPADLPPSSERMGALGALVVQGNLTASLTGEQRRAVQDWVAAGGHLLLAGGPDAARAAGVLPSGVLPVTFAGSDGAANLAPLARWIGVREAVSPGPAAQFKAGAGSLLAGTPDRPLAWRFGLGRGTVTLLAADPSLEPLASWAGTPALLQKALEPALAGLAEDEKMRYIQIQERDNPMRLQSAVESLPPEAYPGWQTIVLILGGFALVVGPMVHLLLRRIDRRGLVWLAVPGAALLLSAALYYGGIGRSGGDVLANVVSHVRLDPGAGTAHQLLAAGFFAPTRSRLAVTVPGDAPVRVNSRGGEPYYSSWGPMPVATSDEPPFRVISGRDTRVEFQSDQWAMRSVILTRKLGQETGGITARIGLEDGLIRGTVRNDTPYPLEDAAVVVGQGLVKLGSLAPGQTAQVVMDPGPVSDPFRGGQPISYRLFGRPPGSDSVGGTASYGSRVAVAIAPVRAPAPPVAVVAPPVAHPPTSAATPTPIPAAPQAAGETSPRSEETASPTPTAGHTATPTPAPTLAPGSASSPPMPSGMPERLELPQDPEVQRRVRLMDAVVNVPRTGPGMPSLPLTFLAFTLGPVGKAFPSAGNHPTYFLTLLEQPLRLELPPGPFTMPAALAPGEIIAQTSRGMGGGSSGLVTWMELYGGSVTYGFRPPLPSRAEVQAVVITTQQMGPASPVSQGMKAPPPGPNFNPGPASSGVFALYNWQSASWDPLPGGQERTRIAPAAPYIGPDGLVKLQVEAPADQALRFIVPELVVEGRVAE